jgi:hypothetical protein
VALEARAQLVRVEETQVPAESGRNPLVHPMQKLAVEQVEQLETVQLVVLVVVHE